MSIDWGKKVKADQKAHPYIVNGRNTCTHCGGSGKVATSSHTGGTSTLMTSRTRGTRKSKQRAHQSSSEEDSAQSSSDSSESAAYSVHSQSGDGNTMAEIDELANDDDDDDVWEDVQDGQAAVPEHAGVTNGVNAQDDGPGDDDNSHSDLIPYPRIPPHAASKRARAVRNIHILCTCDTRQSPPVSVPSPHCV